MNMLQSSGDVVNTYYGWAGDAVGINSKTCTWRLCWLKLQIIVACLLRGCTLPLKL